MRAAFAAALLLAALAVAAVMWGRERPGSPPPGAAAPATARSDGDAAATADVRSAVTAPRVGDGLAGIVVDTDGRPLAGVEVTAVLPPPGEPLATRTAADGAFALRTGAAAELRLVAVLAPFLTGNVAVAAPRAELRIVLHRRPIVRGRVLASDGRPTARYCAALQPLNEGGLFPIVSPPPGAVWAERDDGAFALVADQVGAHALQVFTARGAPAQLQLELQADQVVEQDVRVDPGVLARGVVRDADGGPVAEARLSLQLRASAAVAFAVTGGDGTFAFEPLPAGPAALRVEPLDAPSLRRELELSLATPEPFLDLQLPAGASVTGRVVPWVAGQQAEVVCLHVDGPARRAPVDASSGTFALAGLTPGELTIYVERTEPMWRSRIARLLQGHGSAVHIAVAAGGGAPVELADPVATMARVRGTVQGGGAPDELRVRAFCEDAPLPDRIQGLFRAAPGPDGAFELDGFLPGRWRLQVMRGDDVLCWETVDLAAGADAQVALRVPVAGR